jgi:hypothetical protein
LQQGQHFADDLLVQIYKAYAEEEEENVEEHAYINIKKIALLRKNKK